MTQEKEIVQTSKYSRTYNSYSGCDIVASINISIPGQEPIHHVFGSIQTLSYSIHQEKTPVRAIGNVNAITYVDGPRTIAGTIVFTVLDKHVIYEIFEELTKKGQYVNEHYLMDELPNFDITLSFANEYGHNSSISIYNCTIMDEGQVMSVNDILTENTYHYYATDIDYMTESESYWTINRQKIIESNPWLSPQNFKPQPQVPAKEIDDCPLEKISRYKYRTYAEYVTALNKAYEKHRDELVEAQKTDRIVACRHKYHTLVEDAKKYYKIGDMPYGLNRIPKRRPAVVNKDYDKFRTQIRKTSRAVPDYDNCRVRKHTGPIQAPDFNIRASRTHNRIIVPDLNMPRLRYNSYRDYPEFESRERYESSRSYPEFRSRNYKKFSTRGYPIYKTNYAKHYREDPPEFNSRLRPQKYKVNVPEYETHKRRKVDIMIPEFESRKAPERKREGYPEYTTQYPEHRKIVPPEFPRVRNLRDRVHDYVPDELIDRDHNQDNKPTFKNRKREKIIEKEKEIHKKPEIKEEKRLDFVLKKKDSSVAVEEAKKEEVKPKDKFRIRSVLEKNATPDRGDN